MLHISHTQAMISISRWRSSYSATSHIYLFITYNKHPGQCMYFQSNQNGTTNNYLPYQYARNLFLPLLITYTVDSAPRTLSLGGTPVSRPLIGRTRSHSDIESSLVPPLTFCGSCQLPVGCITCNTRIYKYGGGQSQIEQQQQYISVLFLCCSSFIKSPQYGAR